MSKKIVFIAVIFILLGNTVQIDDEKALTFEVDLQHYEFDEDFFVDNDFYYTTIKLKNLNEFPKYETYIKDYSKGIPKHDSLSYFYTIIDRSFFNDAVLKGDSLPERYKSDVKNDEVLNFSKIKLKPTIIIVVGFNKNKQFIIADANRNRDFSDDVKYEYDIDFRKNPLENINYLNNLPISEYSYEWAYKGNIQLYKRRFILYPDINNRFSISSMSNPKKEREYFSILKFRDYWKGEATIENKKIEFIYHGYSNRYGIIYTLPKGIPYKRFSVGFDSQYCFKYYGNNMFDDTLRIAGSNYVIDSINRPIEKIYLRKVININTHGYRVNDIVNDFVFTDLNDKNFKLKKSLTEKKYTLLEFWGTWCGPCVAMTPKLKTANIKYSKKLNIISIATNDKVKKVKNYVLKHNLNWKFGYIQGDKNWESPIIKELKVKFYPTLLLLNSDGKILARGSSENLDAILKLIK